MKFRRLLPLLVGVILCTTVPVVWAQRAAVVTRSAPAHPAWHLAHGFRNLSPNYEFPVGEGVKRLLRGSPHGYPPRGPVSTPAINHGEALRANTTRPTLTRIGHATFLVQVGGGNIVTPLRGTAAHRCRGDLSRSL